MRIHRVCSRPLRGLVVGLCVTFARPLPGGALWLPPARLFTPLAFLFWRGRRPSRSSGKHSGPSSHPPLRLQSANRAVWCPRSVLHPDHSRNCMLQPLQSAVVASPPTSQADSGGAAEHAEYCLPCQAIDLQRPLPDGQLIMHGASHYGVLCLHRAFNTCCQVVSLPCMMDRTVGHWGLLDTLPG